eukprot:Lithocolla_globosa_v1_NODE_1014_length_2958_cov_1.873103.p5 type:complete len:102 gc:universal NODE_1014_length_2958_cov_1.873103:2390-2085(-)
MFVSKTPKQFSFNEQSKNSDFAEKPDPAQVLKVGSGGGFGLRAGLPCSGQGISGTATSKKHTVLVLQEGLSTGDHVTRDRVGPCLLCGKTSDLPVELGGQQ